MSAIETQLQKIKKSGKIGLMTHVIVGFPTLAATKELILALARGGSDFIELQIPFSDPIADGPTIMKASDIALKNGIVTTDAMQLMKEVAQEVAVPLIFVCYYNTVFAYGVDLFCKDAAAVGAAGLIIPDIPPEEEQYEHIISTAQKYGLDLIRVVSPASSPERLRINAAAASGFVYCISRFGVTGTSGKTDPRLTEYLARVDAAFHLPKAVGFGISTPEQITPIKKHAEIAVVGSAIVEMMLENSRDFTRVETFVQTLKNA